MDSVKYTQIPNPENPDRAYIGSVVADAIRAGILTADEDMAQTGKASARVTIRFTTLTVDGEDLSAKLTFDLAKGEESKRNLKFFKDRTVVYEIDNFVHKRMSDGTILFKKAGGDDYCVVDNVLDVTYINHI